MLVDRKVTGLPVVDGKGRVVGVVSDYDMLALEGVADAQVCTTSCARTEVLIYGVNTSVAPCRTMASVHRGVVSGAYTPRSACRAYGGTLRESSCALSVIIGAKLGMQVAGVNHFDESH